MQAPLPDHVPAALDWRDHDALAAAAELIVSVFADPERYARSRIISELAPLAQPYERTFFAVWMNGRMVGVGGVKTADWASHTHILYLSAVDPAYRGKGIGRALIEARIAWVRSRNSAGNILVSTTRPKRYHRFGFSALRSKQRGKTKLMCLDFEVSRSDTGNPARQR